VDTLFEEDQLASPSPDFTKKVIAQLEQEEKQGLKAPFGLPKWPLLLPVLFFVLCVIYVFNTLSTGTSKQEYTTMFNTLDLSFLDLNILFGFSDSLGYTVTVICLAICVQVILLKKQLDRRFA
ncbi:MAG: hypothetical protein AAF634_16845, partial [Bacteroidota bacterium]